MGEFADIDPNVRKASGLPTRFYGGLPEHEWACGQLLPCAWQPLPGEAGKQGCLPFELLPGALDEPLLFVRDESGRERCLSNVCTHRAGRLIDGPGDPAELRCPYHGRRFDLAGRCLAMPGLEADIAFPTDADNLPEVALERWGPVRFTALAPETGFDAWLEGWDDALPAGLDAGTWRFDPARSPVYEVEAAWALYVDNYLEGLHIAYVHPELSKTLDRTAYETRLLPHGALQVGVARDPADAIPGALDAEGRPVAAYYGWFFPNLMLNVYAWGLSVNVVEPLAADRTRVRYLTYVREGAAPPRGPGSDLGLVERQDQEIVERVQQGVRSRLYRPGRYVPGWEDGVHHFHRMLAARWNHDAGSAG